MPDQPRISRKKNFTDFPGRLCITLFLKERQRTGVLARLQRRSMAGGNI
jgi:hypothetical protein